MRARHLWQEKRSLIAVFLPFLLGTHSLKAQGVCQPLQHHPEDSNCGLSGSRATDFPSITLKGELHCRKRERKQGAQCQKHLAGPPQVCE